jgi:low affinity Fe/Cu permease
MPDSQPALSRRFLQHLGALVANTKTTAIVSVLFLGGLVLTLAQPSQSAWMSRLQTVASVLSLVLLFALQHTQHRDQIAVQRKLDELLQAHPDTDNRLLGLESASDDLLDAVSERHSELAER